MPRLSSERLAERRLRILDGARAAFARYGYEGATVRRLEESTGASRGAIFHHFGDKESLFLAVAEEDARAAADVVRAGGLIEVMRELPTRDPGWLGVQLEVSRLLRTDPAFRDRWRRHLAAVDRAAAERLGEARARGTVRDDVPVETLVTFLRLVHDGLVLHLGTGRSDPDVAAVLDLVEACVRAAPRVVGQDSRRTKERR